MDLLLLARGERVALLCVATVALYVSPLAHPTTQWEFILLYDDKTNFVGNPVLQGDNLFTWENLLTMATMRRINVYEPLSWLLKAFIVQCIGLDSWAIRVVAAVLHFAAGLILLKVSTLLVEINSLLTTQSLCQPGRTPEDARGDTQADHADIEIKQEHERLQGGHHHRNSEYFLGCCLSTLLYLVHPIHVEVVGWPSAQPYTLAALFAYLSLFFYLQSTRSQLLSQNKRREGLLLPFMTSGFQKNDWLVAGFYLYSVLSKSVTVLLPAAFFLVDVLVFFKLKHPNKARVTLQLLISYVTHKALVLFVMLPFIGVTILSNGEDWEDLITLSLGERVLKAAVTPAWTLHHILWPTKLRMHYQLREGELDLQSNPACLLSIVALVLCGVVGFWHWKQHNAPQMMLAMAYFLVMMLPTIGLVQHGITLQSCDRYAYFPSAVLVPFGGYVCGKYLFGADTHDLCEPSTTEDKDSSPESCHHETQVKLKQVDSTYYQAPKPEYQSPIQLIKWLVFGSTLFASVMLSTNLLNTWQNERTLYEHNLRHDPSDWRMHSWLGNAYANTPSVCAANADLCREPWEMAHIFAPTTSLAAKLFRAKVLVPLGKFDQACGLYEELMREYSHNNPLLNNVGICRLLRGGTLSKARALLARAASPPAVGKEKYDHSRLELNLKIFETWAAAFRAEHGDREPTALEKETLQGWVLI